MKLYSVLGNAKFKRQNGKNGWLEALIYTQPWENPISSAKMGRIGKA
jgi:hypothetical protein